MQWKEKQFRLDLILYKFCINDKEEAIFKYNYKKLLLRQNWLPKYQFGFIIVPFSCFKGLMETKEQNGE